jgi:hypothetical protein
MLSLYVYMYSRMLAGMLKHYGQLPRLSTCDGKHVSLFNYKVNVSRNGIE